ncbi:hypothetical protein PVK06_039364 [Gossypium arboreum]|uniref:Uncharacterized protein n=1 Tax=Gossypium arboreum TaxID=29729 RepID=A0ABR0N2N8_GOSAR|nr:hypothetical protein PVK06_039364 [Gossypium arboreum]
MANITLIRAFCVVVLMLLASVWARDVPGKYIDYGRIRGSSPSCGGDLKSCLPQKPAANSSDFYVGITSKCKDGLLHIMVPNERRVFFSRAGNGATQGRHDRESNPSFIGTFRDPLFVFGFKPKL